MAYNGEEPHPSCTEYIGEKKRRRSGGGGERGREGKEKEDK